MSSRWPFKKPDASSSWKKSKSSPPKKPWDRPYVNAMMARVMYCDKTLKGVRDVHLPSGYLLNTRRVPVPPLPR
jgi:hypothetical protein